MAVFKNFKNKNFKKRDYECANVVFCVGESAPDENWEPTQENIPDSMDQLWIQNGVRYYGYL